MTALLHWVYKAAIEHEAVLGLLLLAFVVTMRPKLPSPFCNLELLEWSYEWLHDALKAFMSFRSPNPPGETTVVTDSHSHTVEKLPPDPTTPNEYPEAPAKETTK